MKKYILISLLFLNIIPLYSQPVKTYSGSFKNGTATYQYYENDNYERIYDGSFIYKAKSWGVNLQINGKYSKGEKIGLWNYTIGEFSKTGKYVEGKLSGKWIEKNNVNNKVKTFASFINGRFAGEFSYNYKNTVISGKFNEIGVFDGVWTIKFSSFEENYEDIRKYNNGVLYWSLLRNSETGEIKDKYDNTTFVNSFFSNLDTIKNTSVVDGIEYTTSPNLADNSNCFDLCETENGKMYESIGGWLYFENEQSEIYYTGLTSMEAPETLYNSYHAILEIVPYKQE